MSEILAAGNGWNADTNRYEIGAHSHGLSLCERRLMEVGVTRYYMQLRDGTDNLLDPEGIEYADIDELKKKVLIAVRGLMSEDLTGGVIDLRFRIDAEDREGVIVYTLGFAEAVKIIPDDK